MLAFQDIDFVFQNFRHPDVKQPGNLYLFKEIKIKGNHTKGPVNVDIDYVCRFKPLKPVVESNGDETYSVEKTFSTQEERDAYCKSFFKLPGDWSANKINKW